MLRSVVALFLIGCGTSWGPSVPQGKLLHPLELELRSLVANCGMGDRRTATEGGDTALPPILYEARLGQKMLRELSGDPVAVASAEALFDTVYQGRLTNEEPTPERRTDMRLVQDGSVRVVRDASVGGSFRYHCKTYAFAALEGGYGLGGADAKAALEGKHQHTSAVVAHVGRFSSDLAERLAAGESAARQELLALHLRHPELAEREASLLREVTAAVVMVTEAGEADSKASGSIGWSGSFLEAKGGVGNERVHSGEAKNTLVSVGHDALWTPLPSPEALARGLVIEPSLAPESFNFVLETVPAEVALTAKVSKGLCERRWWSVSGEGKELLRVVVDPAGCRFVVRVDWKALSAAERAAAASGEVRVPIALAAAVGKASLAVNSMVALKSGQEPFVVLKTSDTAASDREVAFTFDVWTSIVTDEFARRFKVGQTWGAPSDAKVRCGSVTVPVEVRVHQPVNVGAPPALWLGVPRAVIAPFAGQGCTFSVTLGVPVVEREGNATRQVKWALQDRRLDIPPWLQPPRPAEGAASGAPLSEPPAFGTPVAPGG